MPYSSLSLGPLPSFSSSQSLPKLSPQIPMSPLSSYPSSGTPPVAAGSTRRLTTRRGSVAASDPWGHHAKENLNPERTTSSRLTIVRVTSPPVNLEEPPRPGSPHHRRHPHPHASLSHSHRRLGSSPSSLSGSSPTASAGREVKETKERLSFASSSFGGGATSGPGGRPGSPTSGRPGSPVQRPGPPSHHQRSHSFSKKKLSPEELYDLARQATNPTYTPSPRHSPVITTPHSPISRDGQVQQEKMTPASFTQLPDDVYLPFIDRPSEVALMMTTIPTAKLFALLAQIFPVTRDLPPSQPPDQSPDSSPSLHPNRLSTISSSSSLSSLSASFSATTQPPSLTGDPLKWTWPQLSWWLKHVDRDQADDVEWVRKARRCVMGHSELVWERVKGALGVPCELDGEWDGEVWGDVKEGSVEREGGVAVEGGSGHHHAHGPEPSATSTGISPMNPLPSAFVHRDPHTQHHHHHPKETDVEGDVTGAGPMEFDEDEEETLSDREEPDADTDDGEEGGRWGGGGGGGYEGDEEEDGYESVSIEQVVVHPTPPLVGSDAGGAGAGGLGDIGEEGEEEGEGGMTTLSSDLGASTQKEKEANVIQGLRISTLPSNPSSLGGPVQKSPFFFAVTGVLHPYSVHGGEMAHSPVDVHGHGHGLGQGQTPSGSNPNSAGGSGVNSAGGSGLNSAGGSGTNSLTNSPRMMRRLSFGSQRRLSFGSTAGGGTGGGGRGEEGGLPFDVLRDRGPGNPLFPSNFANLALGPTLSANNPALRTPTNPPAPAYSNPHAIRGQLLRRRGLGSWADGWDPSKQEYAVSFDSGSSVGE
ncbi:hypothetical protein JAAARDRAFT_54710 [Jaapia argillacea MUCL 33604]|uniref:Uncharacterized protein n=1 Tax=Jaapia argillacea MUCL 33604 TaxID=933084 RepID=A0A067QCU3_9AGAM|nr:hypothetical protein JAAARDRAFT_54710 [Jaapia argillacea MUCL 33604]